MPCYSVSHGRYNMDVEVASDFQHESLTPMYDAMQDRIASLRSLMAEILTYDQHAEELVARERDLDTAITSVSQQVVSFDARLGPLRAQIERQRSVLARLQVLVGQHESSHLMPHTSDTHELETTLALKLSEIEALENEAAMSTVCADVVSIGSLPEQFSTAGPSLHEVELDLHMLAERDGGGVALHAELLAHYDLLVESFAAHVYADATDPLSQPGCFDAHGDGVVSAAGRVAFLRAIGLVRTSSHGESSGNGENIGGAGAFRFHRQWSVQTSSITSAKAALVLAAQVRFVAVSIRPSAERSR